MNDFYYDAGMRIKELREQSKYTGEELAELADLSPKYLNNVELGKQGFAGDTLYRIAKALHVTCDYILTGEEEVESKLVREIVEVVKMYDEKEQEKILKLLKYIREM